MTAAGDPVGAEPGAGAHRSASDDLTRRGLAIAADLASLAVSFTGRAVGLPRLPTKVAGLVPALQAQPAVRRAASAVFGEANTDTALAMMNALVQGVAQGTAGPGVDLAAQGLGLVEVIERRRGWDREGLDELTELLGLVEDDVLDREDPLRASMAGRAASGLAATQLTAGLGVLVSRRDVRRAAGVTFGLTPKAALLGREAYAAGLGRVLARQGLVLPRGDVLRQFDRIDTVVFDLRPDLGVRLPARDLRSLAAAARRCGLEAAAVGIDLAAAERAGVGLLGAATDGWSDVLPAVQAGGGAVAVVSLDGAGLTLADCGIATRPPRHSDTPALLHEAPEESLGASLDQAILARAGTTATGAALAWAGAQLTDLRPNRTDPRRAATITLASLVGTQLGQTLTGGRPSAEVVGATAVSAGALAAVIQTPCVNRLFGCTALGPVGWGVAIGSSAAATLAAPLVERLVTATSPQRLQAFISGTYATPEPVIDAVY